MHPWTSFFGRHPTPALLYPNGNSHCEAVIRQSGRDRFCRVERAYPSTEVWRKLKPACSRPSPALSDPADQRSRYAWVRLKPALQIFRASGPSRPKPDSATAPYPTFKKGKAVVRSPGSVELSEFGHHHSYQIFGGSSHLFSDSFQGFDPSKALCAATHRASHIFSVETSGSSVCV